MAIKPFDGAESITNFMVIGKIPGYNNNINSNKIATDYEQRLRANLTTVRIRPTGYYLQISSLGQSMLDAVGTFVDTAKDVVGYEKNTSLEKKTDLFSIGRKQTLGGTIDATKGVYSTTNAMAMWKTLMNSNFDNKSNGTQELRILATNDSTITEVLSNTFSTSAVEQLAASAGNYPFSKTVKNYKKIVSIDSSYGLSLLSKGTDNAFLNVLAGKTLGVQSAFPDEWASSSYDNTLQLMIKLVSPSGDKESIKEYITKPLKMLMVAAAPISYDGFNFGYPTVFEVQAEGLMDMKLAGITAMTISRGGNETQFNRFNQPLNIDVRLTIRPLVSAFASSITDQIGEINDASMQLSETDKNYDKFIMTNPKDVETSMSVRKTDKSDEKSLSALYYKEIKL